MLGFVFAALAYSWSTRPKTPTTISFSEFLEGLKGDDPKYSKLNVHELVIDRGYITFQSEANGPDGEPSKSAKHWQVPIEKLFEADQGRLLSLLESKDIRHSYSKPISPWPELMVYTAFLVLFLVFFLFMLRRLGGPGAAMSFSRSRGKLFAQEDVKVTFSDVAGIDEAVEELKEVVEFLRTPQKYQALGGRIPRSVAGRPTGHRQDSPGESRRG